MMLTAWNRSLDTLKDVNLEPRDCLSLWKSMLTHQNERYPIDQALNPRHFFSKLVKKSDVVGWESALKKQLGAWMIDSESPFDMVRDDLRGDRYRHLVNTGKGSPQTGSAARKSAARSSAAKKSAARNSADPDLSEFSLVLDLRSNGALPAIIFNYDRARCEMSLFRLLETLENGEAEYRKSSPEWAAKMTEYERWKQSREKANFKPPRSIGKGKGRVDEGATRLDLAREEANREMSPWESFDPNVPLAEFSFADMFKISKEQLESYLDRLRWQGCKPALLNALRRGLGVHHAGMNRQYRQV
jgi:hypothetical protein